MFKVEEAENETTLMLNNSLSLINDSVIVELNVSDGHFSMFVTLILFILQEKSNKPVYTTNIYNCTVYKSPTLFDMICSVECNNSIPIHCTLISENDKFAILSIGHISVSSYNITINSYFQFPHSFPMDSAIVNIQIQDLNDNKSTLPEYIFTDINENALYGTQ